MKRYKTKRRTRDLDLIYDDLSQSDRVGALMNQQLDETKPGLAQHYCIHCARYFETPVALRTHLRGKVHRRRVKELRGVPYTQEVADAAAGVNLQKFLDRVEKVRVGESAKLENEAAIKEHVERSATESPIEAIDDQSEEMQT